jgi:hypothetical protein
VSSRVVATVVLGLLVGLAGCSGGTGEEAATSASRSLDTEVKTWPGPATTGSRGALERRPGTTVDKDGTELTGIWFEGQVTIAADDVVLRNVTITSDSYYALLVTGHNVLIEDVTLRGGPNSIAALASTEGGQFVARRVDASGAEDGVRLGDDCALQDSYVHGLRGGEGRHNDAVTADGYHGWSITGNTVLNALEGGVAAVWVGDARFGGSSGVLADNLLGGGGYVIYAGPGAREGIRVHDNAFSTRFWPKSGHWGLAYEWVPEGNEWADNVWADGPEEGALARP